MFETNNSNNQGTRDLPNNINGDREEVKLPNKIETLSSQEFKGDELTTYRNELKSKEKMLHISDSLTVFNLMG